MPTCGYVIYIPSMLLPSLIDELNQYHLELKDMWENPDCITLLLLIYYFILLYVLVLNNMLVLVTTAND